MYINNSKASADIVYGPYLVALLNRLSEMSILYNFYHAKSLLLPILFFFFINCFLTNTYFRFKNKKSSNYCDRLTSLNNIFEPNGYVFR